MMNTSPRTQKPIQTSLICNIMSSKEQSVTLLRRNKQAQVEAFRSIGMADVSDDMRASDFARRIKWAAGLLDLCLCAVRRKTIDGVDTAEEFYFTQEEWAGLSATQQLTFLKKGLRVRAFSHQFTLAPSDASNNAALAWSNNVNIDNIENRLFGAAYRDFDGATNTAYIIEEQSGQTGSQNVTGCPAAEAAVAYKAFTAEFDGLEDTSDWHLPGFGCLWVYARLKSEIDEAFKFFWSADSCLNKTTGYWSSTEATGSEAWFMEPNACFLRYGSKSTKYRVRPVCDEQ